MVAVSYKEPLSPSQGKQYNFSEKKMFYVCQTQKEHSSALSELQTCEAKKNFCAFCGIVILYQNQK